MILSPLSVGSHRVGHGWACMYPSLTFCHIYFILYAHSPYESKVQIQWHFTPKILLYKHNIITSKVFNITFYIQVSQLSPKCVLIVWRGVGEVVKVLKSNKALVSLIWNISPAFSLFSFFHDFVKNPAQMAVKYSAQICLIERIIGRSWSSSIAKLQWCGKKPPPTEVLLSRLVPTVSITGEY